MTALAVASPSVAQTAVETRVTLEELSVEGAAQGGAAGIATGRGPVPGYVARVSAVGTKTDTPLIETPQSISVISRQQIQDQQAQSVSDILRYAPGVQADSNGFDARTDNFRIRGFDQSVTGLFQDGLRLYNFNNQAGFSPEPYGLERVDILRGPSSVLFGQSSPGGIVNLISKVPTSVPFREVQLQGGTYGRVQGAFDLSGPANPENTVLYRLTGVARQSDTSLDLAKDDRLFLAPAITFKPDAATTLTLLSSVQHDELGSTYNVLPRLGTLLPNINGTLPMSRTVNDRTDYFDRTRYSFGYQFEHRFDEALTFRQNFRYLDLETKYQQTGYNGLNADQRTVPRSVNTGRENITNLVVDNQVQYDLDHGAIQQKILVGLDAQSLGSRSYLNFSSALPTDVFGAPTSVGPLSNILISSPDSSLGQVGVYFQDQIKIDERLILTVGGRQDWATTRTTERVTGAVSNQNDSAFTSRVGATYLLDYGFAPYFSYAESFLPIAGLDFNGAAFRPTTGVQYEGGIKFEPPGLNTVFTVAGFDITQQNVQTTDLQHIGFSVQTGEVHARGFEFEVRSNLAPGLNVIASYTHSPLIITKDNDGNVGKLLQGVAPDYASGWIDYTFQSGPLRGLGIAGGVRYVDYNYGDSANTIRVPPYYLFDGALRYKLGTLSRDLEGWTLAVNATNIADRRYVSQCGYFGDGCRYGYGRTVLGTVRYNW